MKNMKAVVLNKIGHLDNLKLEMISIPKPRENEVLVKIKASALNHRDIWIVKGLYAKINIPVVLGSDGCGVVTSVGKGVDPSWVGKSVVINPGLAWGNNPSAQAQKFRILGMPDNGTFANYVVVPGKNIWEVPQNMTAEEAAAIPLGGLTGHRALFRQGNLRKGENVLITGIGGGVATLMLKMALKAGANVYVTSSNANKIQQAQKYGAKAGVNYQLSDWPESLKSSLKDNQLDLIIDSAGGANFKHLIELVKPGGRIVVFGATAGNVPEVNLRRIFWKQIQVRGTTMGNPDDFSNMIEFFRAKNVKPVIDEVFELENYQMAFQKIMEGKQFGKIILKQVE